MQSGSAAKPADAQRLVKEACDRNVPVELHQEDQSGPGCLLVARARMILVDDQHLYLDQLQSVDRNARLRRGDAVTAYFSLAHERYTFDSRIIEPRCKVRLNEFREVLGTVIRRPKQVVPGQRRASYRVSLAGVGPVSATLQHAERIDDEVHPVGNHREAGTVVEISGGGVGMTLAHPPNGEWQPGHLIFLRFENPEGGEDYFFLAEVRHVRAINDDTITRLGIAFHHWPDPRHTRRQTAMLERFSARLQRRSIKKSA